MVPVGVPEPELTATVNVTWPKTEGFGEEINEMRVVASPTCNRTPTGPSPEQSSGSALIRRHDFRPTIIIDICYNYRKYLPSATAGVISYIWLESDVAMAER